jgi:radical SAM protein with 4Fe4S-binding SPASM domain
MGVVLSFGRWPKETDGKSSECHLKHVCDGGCVFFNFDAYCS